MKLPVWHSFGRRRVARLAVTAMRNEAHSLNALQRFDEAAQLRLEADRLERRLLALEPIPYKAAPVEVVIEPDPSPAVSSWVHDYQHGAWPGSPM